MRTKQPDILSNYPRNTVFRTVMYFNKPHQDLIPGIRDNIVNFVEMVSETSFGYYYGLDGEAETFSRASFLELVDLWFSGPFGTYPNATIELDGHDYAVPEYGLRYWGKAMNDPGFPGDTSFLHVWLPASFFLEQPAAVDSYLRASLMRVPACSAYANWSVTGGDMRDKQALASRYLGLDIAEPESVSIDLATRCPGSYWTSYLGPELVGGLGGLQAVREAIEHIGTVEEFPDGGVLTRLTAEPELGDQNRGDRLPNYEAFARFVNAKGYLHVPQKSVYFEDEQGFADPDAQERWHMRFVR